MDDYTVLASSGEAELKIERSRFLALASPAADEAAARAAVAAMVQRYHDCRHVCHAWRLGSPPGVVEVRSDGGEPAGTAGEPILVAIRRADVTGAVVVVARYFGGVKLGTGGLARAYGAAAAEALAQAPRRTVRAGRRFALHFAYAQQNLVRHVLEQFAGRVLAEDFGVDVGWQVWVPWAGADAFVQALRDATAGTVEASLV